MGKLLDQNILFWLIGGYLLGVLACSYTTAFFLGASPGEFLLGLTVQNSKEERLNGISAVIYSLVRLFWPIMILGTMLSMLISGKMLDTVITGCAAVRAASGSPGHTSAEPVLHIEEGYYKGNTLTLKPGKYVFGRNPEVCNMVYPMNYASVSRVHFSLDVDQNYHIVITDYSSYGTWLNSSPLEKNKPTPVNPDGVISFANNQEKILIKNL